MTITDLVTRKTRKGAESYITNSLLGFPPGEWFEDYRWAGQEQVTIRIRFTVEERGPKQFTVVREYEDVTTTSTEA
jgi:hypothetical protein